MMEQNSLPFPVSKATLPFWRTQPHPLDTFRSTEVLPGKCDILIIGAGYAGISTTYHLVNSTSDSDPAPSIVLLEAREACSGATGRNGGHLRPSFPFPELIEKHGIEACVEIALFELAHIAAIQSLISTHKIDCDFTLTRTHTIPTDPAVASFVGSLVSQYTSASPEIAKHSQWTEGKEAEELSGVKGVVGDWSNTAAHLWPYKLFLHLLQIAVDKDVNLQTNTPVLSSSNEQDTEGYWTFQTPRGTIKAKKVVFATNGYTAGILPEYRDVIVPRKACCSYISTLASSSSSPDIETKRLGNGKDSSYRISPPAGEFDYLIQRPDGSVVVGGGSALYKGERGVAIGNWDDSTLIPQLGDHFEGYLGRWFKQGGEGEKLGVVWSGIQGQTLDTLPHIGPVPGKEGMFIIAGFNGHGMPVIHLSAKGLVEMMVEGKGFKETGVPRLFETTRERLEVKAVF
ncbi:FAD dependent oxidoreductase [Acephala macrosclerotiorum]|nr:FAD dependent oxidoreductase [Acephala macrosclerotiorum]